MAFNVSSFKSSARGFLRPHSFEVFILPPGSSNVGSLNALNSIRLRTEGIALPGAAFLTADNYRQYGNGLTYTIPYGSNPQEIIATHTVDDRGNIIQILYDWVNEVVDLKGDFKYAPAYYEEYTRDMVINIYEQSGTKIKTYRLTGVYPISYDQIQMAWEATDQITKIPVTYRYEYFTIE